MRLSHVAIAKASPREKPRMLADGAGLSLLVQPNGSKLWRFRYRFGGPCEHAHLGRLSGRVACRRASKARRRETAHQLRG
jgi:hypothetical protein